MKLARVSIVSAATGTSFNGQLPAHGEGFALCIKVTIPQVAGTPTVTLNVYDIDGTLVFSKASLAENATTMIYSQAEAKDIPCMAGATINLTFTTAPGVATSTVTFYLIN